jgi:hypothetical protein
MRITYIDSDIIHQSIIPSNRTYNDIDFVPPTQYSIPPTRKAKEPLQPWPLPPFKPLYITSFNNYSTLNLPLNSLLAKFRSVETINVSYLKRLNSKDWVCIAIVYGNQQILRPHIFHHGALILLILLASFYR